jgi:rSAM/selenodomain-associated transferase 2
MCIRSPLVPISVIVPTLDEEQTIAQTLANLRRQRPHEIIVADGGSRDDTCLRANDADLVVQAPRGRATQMNQGAAHATGDVLLFLHADCSLEATALAEAERCIDMPGVAAGCFSMRVDADGLWYRLIDRCATARVCLSGLAYGDQGLFLRRDLFQQLGGFPQLALMEDLFFSRALRRHGRIVVAASRIHVSPRRWRRTGLVPQTIRNWLLTALAFGGVHPDGLARFYPPVR